MKKSLLKVFTYLKVSILLSVFILSLPDETLASRFKGGNISYEALGNGHYKFTVSTYWRHDAHFVMPFGPYGISALDFSSPPVIDSPLSPPVDFYQPYSTDGTLMLQDGLTREYVQTIFVHWDDPGIYEVSTVIVPSTVLGCCRVTNGNNFDNLLSYKLWATVNYSDTSSLNESISYQGMPIFYHPESSPLLSFLPYEVAEGYEMTIEKTIPYGFENNCYLSMESSGFSISLQGVISWTDPQPGTWGVAVKTRLKRDGVFTGSWSVQEFLIKVEADGSVANNVPVCSNPTPVDLMEGDTVSLEFEAYDPDHDLIDLHYFNMPEDLGALLTLNDLGDTIKGQFEWVPPTGSAGSYISHFFATDQGVLPYTCYFSIPITVIDPDVTFVSEIMDETCPGNNDGSITIHASGGVPPYQYSFNGGWSFAPDSVLSDLAPGTYDLIVSDMEGTLSPVITVSVEGGVAYPPDLSCPVAYFFDSDPTLCSGTVTIPPPFIYENCSEFSLSNNITGTASVTSISFPTGSNPVVWYLTNGMDTLDQCTVLVIVEDEEAPAISCPEDILIDTSYALCTLFLDPGTPFIADNCTISSLTNDFTGTGSAAAEYPIGNTYIMWQVFDASGNSNECTQLIELNAPDKPIMFCPSPVIAYLDSFACETFVNLPQPTVSGECSVLSVSNNITGTDDASAIYARGSNEISWTMIDISGSDTSCVAVVEVFDTIAPIISCPEDLLLYAQPGSTTLQYSYAPPVYSDNCAVGPPQLVVGKGSGGLFPIGSGTELYVLADDAGNLSSCSFTVDVRRPTWKIECVDGQMLDILGVSFEDAAVTTLNIPDFENVDSIIAEVICKGSDLPEYCTFWSLSDSIIAVGNPILFDTDTSSKVFRVKLDAASAISASTLLPEKAISLMAYVYRSGPDITPVLSCGQYSQVELKNQVYTQSFEIPMDDNPRDIKLLFPVSDIQDNSKMAIFRAYAGAVSDTLEVDSSGLGEGVNIESILLQDVPGNVSSVHVEVESPVLNGESFIFGLALSIECTAEPPPFVCAIPGGLFEQILSTTNVKLNWEDVSQSQIFQIKGRKLGTTPFGSTTTPNIFKNIGNLLPGTSYEWKVRVLCENGDISGFSPLSQFSMPAARNSATDHTLAAFPIPADRELNIELSGNEFNAPMLLEMFDVKGVRIKSELIYLEGLPLRLNWDTSTISEGVYILKYGSLRKEIVINH